MEKPKSYEPSEEEILKATKERTLSDAELVKGGAEYVLDEEAEEPRLEVTNKERREALMEAVLDMDDERRQAMFPEYIKDKEKKEEQVYIETKDGRYVQGYIYKVHNDSCSIGSSSSNIIVRFSEVKRFDDEPLDKTSPQE